MQEERQRRNGKVAPSKRGSAGMLQLWLLVWSCWWYARSNLRTVASWLTLCCTLGTAGGCAVRPRIGVRICCSICFMHILDSTAYSACACFKRYAAGTACNMEEASSTKIWGRLQHSAPARWGIDEQRADMTLPLFERGGGRVVPTSSQQIGLLATFQLELGRCAPLQVSM